MVDINSLYANERIICDKEYLYYLASEISTVIRIDLETKQGSSLFTVDEYKKEFVFRTIAKHKQSIFLFPLRMEKYVIYNIETKKYIFKNIPNDLIGLNWSGNYYLNENTIIFFFAEPIIVEYNIPKDEWEIIDIKSSICEEYIFIFEKEHFFGDGSFKHRDSLYFQLNQENKLLKYNIKTKKIEVIEIGMFADYKIEIINYMNGIVYYLSRDNKGNYVLGLWNMEGGCSKISEMEQRSSEHSYSQLILANENIIVLPFRSDKSYKINLLDGNIFKDDNIPCVPKRYLKPKWGREFNYAKGCYSNGKYLNMNMWRRQIIEIDLKTSLVKKYGFELLGEGEILFKCGKVVQEQNGFALENYLKYI